MKTYFIWIGVICTVIIIGVPTLSITADLSVQAAKQELIFLTWSEYMDPDLIKEFEEKYKVKIKFVYFETEDKREQLLALTMGKGYDVVLASGIKVESYIMRNWLFPLSSDRIPNIYELRSCNGDRHA